MSGIISESFINKWPRLGRAHLRLQNVFLGWAPKLPDSRINNGFFHATLCIYFTAFLLCLLSLQSHLENIFGSCRNRRTEIVELFYVQRLHIAEDRGPPHFFPSFLLLLFPRLPSSPVSPSSLPATFFLFLLNNHKKKIIIRILFLIMCL